MSYRRYPLANPSTLSVDKAFQSVGVPLGGDCNDPDAPAMGFFHLEAAIDKSGRRISAYQAFLNKKTAQERRDRLTICKRIIYTEL